RPTVADIYEYRAHVDRAMVPLLERLDESDGDAELRALVTLGLNHEQQHQELIVLDVRDDELLMLLLVIEAKRHQRAQLGVAIAFVQPLEQRHHRAVHVRAVLVDVRHGRSRDEAALRAAMALARLHIVRVEQVGVARIQRLIPRHVRRENEGLEEPARVRDVPLRGAHVRHGAHHVVLGDERLAERMREGAHATIALEPPHIRSRVLLRYGPCVARDSRGHDAAPVMRHLLIWTSPLQPGRRPSDSGAHAWSEYTSREHRTVCSSMQFPRFTMRAGSILRALYRLRGRRALYRRIPTFHPRNAQTSASCAMRLSVGM